MQPAAFERAALRRRPTGPRAGRAGCRRPGCAGNCRRARADEIDSERVDERKQGGAQRDLAVDLPPDGMGGGGIRRLEAGRADDLRVDRGRAECGGVQGLRRPVCSAGQQRLEEDGRRLVVGIPGHHPDLNAAPRPPDGWVVRVVVGIEAQAGAIAEIVQQTYEVAAHSAFRRVVADRRHDDCHARRPGARDQAPRARDIGGLPDAGCIRARGVGTERLVAGEPRRQDLAGRPGEVRASGHRDDRRTIDGQCERAAHRDANERRHAGIEEHAVELRERPRVELQRDAAAETSECSGERVAQHHVRRAGGNLRRPGARVEAEAQRDAIGKPGGLARPPTTGGSADCARARPHDPARSAGSGTGRSRAAAARRCRPGASRRGRPIRTEGRACRGSPDRARSGGT